MILHDLSLLPTVTGTVFAKITNLLLFNIFLSVKELIFFQKIEFLVELSFLPTETDAKFPKFL
jgi:hypothetical protein